MGRGREEWTAGAWKSGWAQGEAAATLRTTSPVPCPEDAGVVCGCGRGLQDRLLGCCEGLRLLPKEGMWSFLVAGNCHHRLQ